MKPGRRKRVAVAVASIAILLAGAGPHEAPPAPSRKADRIPLPQRASPNPIQTVRVFSALQERIVLGSAEALQRQAGLAKEIGEILLKFGPDTWNDARNRQAAIKFVLMGGDPKVVEALSRRAVFKGFEVALANGALAFAYGDRKAAEVEFGSVDPRSLPPGLGGYAALIMAVLVGVSDPSKGLAFSDEARLLSLGTGVEEAALRLSIELAIAANSPQHFYRAFRHHVRRFPSSLYGPTIDLRIARVLAANELKLGPDADALAVIMDSDLPQERRLRLLEELVKAGLRRGVGATVALAAQHLRTLADGDPNLLDLCRAADAASAIFDGRRSEARTLLSQPDSAAATSESKALLEELRALIVALEAPPAKLEIARDKRSGGISGSLYLAQAPLARFESLTKQVETALDDADKLLRRTGS